MAEEKRPRAWPVLGEEHKGDHEMFRVRVLRARSPKDGTEHTFNIADAPDGVIVVALTPDDELVLVEQWRHPLQRVTLELPSGVIDPGEAPEIAGPRELREETGYAGSEPEYLGALTLNPSWQTTRVHAVVIRDARPAGDKELDEAEDTRARRVPLEQVRRMVAEGEIDASPMVGALALFALARGG